eukprot:gnl/MRDRNA2_/MRDRNA2_28213_c0_seq1.p1 gnl/MRDRNA2_/MRDRNA2_28213_c0~~gnl/MRDRNA2_/MRDRNA2_28213_c0_seq1.p1  ORF type:complete len:895 (-),score=119.75 gnl/MRDRNA2_/MRDRNA2_28213_c0_seq1:94-2778(-)
MVNTWVLVRSPVGKYFRYLFLPWTALCSRSSNEAMMHSVINDFNSNGAALIQTNPMRSIKPGGNREGAKSGPYVMDKEGGGKKLPDDAGKHHQVRLLAVVSITLGGGLLILGAWYCRHKREDWVSNDGDSVPSQSATQTPRTPSETPLEQRPRSKEKSLENHALAHAKRDASSISHTPERKHATMFTVFGHEVEVDEIAADYVIMLPLRGHSSTNILVAGADVQVMHWDEVIDGLTLAHGLIQPFMRNHIISPEELSQTFQHEMSREAFILNIRKLVVELLVGPNFGLNVKVTPSVDHDELVMKLSIPKKNSSILQYAANVGYKMPLSNAAYERIGSSIIKDKYGTEMRAVTEFVPEHSDCFEHFSRIDRLVLLRARLDRFLDLDGLHRQGVISAHFPLHNYTEVVSMREGWANPWRWFQLPTSDYRAHNSVRNYFGEEVAWMFVWHSYFTRALMFPAAIGAGIYYCHYFLSVTIQNELQIGFAVFMGLWCTWFNAYYDRKESRIRHSWGMNDFTPVPSLLKRYDYKPDLDGTWRVDWAPVLGDLLAMVFVCLSVSGMYFIEEFRQTAIDRSAHWMWIQSAALLISLQIFVLDKCWRSASMFVTSLENHRSETDWLDSWVLKMFPVRLFNNLYPFLYIGFMKQYTRAGCPKVPGGCLHELETDLITYFLLRVISEFGVDVAYLVVARAEILAEMKKKASQGRRYTYVEVQSKALGYDKLFLMNDWTEQVLTFAFVSCFSVVLPAISLIALLTNLVETRLVAYRIACFLRRPLPVAANGIGAWRQMLFLIEIIAVIVNFAFAVFAMSPLNLMDPTRKLLCFLVGEHVALLLKILIKHKYPPVPKDVTEVARRQHQDIKRTFVDLQHHPVKADVIVEQAPDVGPRALGGRDFDFNT